MPRELKNHRLGGLLNQVLQIVAVDDPGHGGASHKYRLIGPEPHRAPQADIWFQNGAVKETGEVNGFTNECLLAIVEDRLLGFQSGEFACHENEVALMKVQEAMLWLAKRSCDRATRDVEGTHQK